jgi:hypothetical protein
METNSRVLSKALQLSGAAMLLALAGNAQADVIAVAIDNITNFQFSSSGPGSVQEANPNSTASAAANFNAISNSSGTAICPGAGPCNGGNLSANPLQQTARDWRIPWSRHLHAATSGRFCRFPRRCERHQRRLPGTRRRGSPERRRNAPECRQHRWSER